MSLLIYEGATSDLALSIDSLFLNPLILSFDGRVGGSIERRLYIKGDNSLHEYTNITLEVEQFEGSIDLINGTNGFSMKLKAGDTRPSAEEWRTISAGNQISLSDVTGEIDAIPFWVRIETPQNVSEQQFRGVRFVLSATQQLI